MEIKGEAGDRYAELKDKPKCHKCDEKIGFGNRARICDECEKIYCLDCTHNHITGGITPDKETRRYTFTLKEQT